MKKYKRFISLKALLKQNSHFLFGPRATGKSFLIKEDLPNCTVYNLLDDEVYSSLMRRPKIIEEAITSKNQIIVIDEIQKLPKLLDEVHRLIESKKARFLLTGSSVRKLKKEGHNLLAGRAWEAHLFPLTWKEIPNFNLIHYLNYGGLPRIYLSKNPKEELFHYVNSYLKEEIKEEAVVRSYEKFVYFLDAISLMNAKELHYQNLSSECGVPVRTLEGYIEVLIDTLIGFELLPYRKTKKRIAYARSKFYFFEMRIRQILAMPLKLLLSMK
jgi:predicted AAA+ superfamily ATPase